MADINKINLYDTVYNLKDSTARESSENAITVANGAHDIAGQALNKANTNTTNITNVKKEIPVITYDNSKEQITITKGV